MKLRTAASGFLMVSFNTEKLLSAHPGIMDFLRDAARKLILPEDGSIIESEVEMGRIIGRSMCVETPKISLSEEVYFAQRFGRNRPSRVSLDSDGQMVSTITIIATAKKGTDNDYCLRTAYIGKLATREPWSKHMNKAERDKCIEFWTTHALIHDPKVMSPAFKSTWHEILGSEFK